MPLNAERKAWRVGDADRLDRAVLGDALDHDPRARLENALPMQRVYADGLAAEELREGAARNQVNIVAVGKDHGGVGMNFAVLQSRHAMVHAPRQLPDLRMQCAAKGDVHLLEATADAEDRDAAGYARLRQRQGHGVAMLVVGLMPGVRLGLEPGRMDVGAGACQQHAVDDIQQRVDIGDIRRARKHQRQGTCNLRDRAQIPFPVA